MKTSKFFLSTLIAAAAMTTSAYAVESSASGTVVTALDSENTLREGQYIVLNNNPEAYKEWKVDFNGKTLNVVSTDMDGDWAGISSLGNGVDIRNIDYQMDGAILKGSGNLALFGLTGHRNQTFQVYLDDLNEATDFSGKITAFNTATKPTEVHIGGVALRNAEFVFGGSSGAVIGGRTPCTVGSGNGGVPEGLVLVSDASIGGISGSRSTGNEFVQASENDITLTLSGSGDYIFNGKFGVFASYNTAVDVASVSSYSERAINIEKTGSGTQTLSGTNNIGTLSVSDGTLNLSGTTNIAGDVTVSGGALTLGGTNTLGGTVSVAEDATFTFSGGLTHGSTLSLTSGEATISSGDRAFNGNLIVGAEATVTGDKTDSINYSANSVATAQSVTVAGNLVLNNRWTMGTYNDLILKGGTISGSGQSSNDYAALDYYQSGKISVTAAGSKIEAIVRVKSGTTLEMDVADGASLDISGEMVLNHNGNTTTDTTIKKTGQGVLTLSAGRKLKGNADDSRAVYDVQGGSLVVDADLAGSFSVADTASLSVNADKTLTLSGTTNIASEIQNSGKVALSGNVALGDMLRVSGGTLDFTNVGKVTLSDTFKASGATYTDYSGASSKNGYQGGQIKVYDASGATITGSLDSVDYGGKTETLTDGAFTADTNYATYYVNSDTVNLSDILSDSNANKDALTGIVVADSATFSIDQNYTWETYTIDGKASVASAGIVDLGTLNSALVDYTSLEGDGTIKFKSAQSQAGGVTLSDNFRGTLVVSGSADLPAKTVLGGATKVVIDGAFLWTGSTKTYTQAFDVVGEYVGFVDGNLEENIKNLQRGSDGHVSYEGVFTLKENASFGVEEGTTTFKGGVVGEAGSTLYVNEGTVEIVSGTSAINALKHKAGTLTISGGTNDITDLTISGGTTTISGGTNTVTGLTISGGTTTISGGTNTIAGLTISGGETTTVSVSNGTTTVTNGVVVNGGTLSLGKYGDGSQSALRGVITINNTGCVTLTGGDATGYNGGVTSIHTLVINEGGKLKITTNSNAGVNQTFNMSGGITLKGGTIEGTNENGYSKFDLYASGMEVKSLSSSETSLISASVGLRRSGIFNVEKGTTESGIDLHVSGMLTNLGKINTENMDSTSVLTKKGLGTLKLSGDNRYWSRGGTIEAGTLIAAHENALGSGAISVERGANLQLAMHVETTGTVTLLEGAKLVVDLADFDPSALTLSAEDPDTMMLSVLTANLTLGSVAATEGTLSGDYFTLENSGAFADYDFDGWVFRDGTLSLSFIAAIPEPSAFGLLAGVGALALVVSRRRRSRR